MSIASLLGVAAMAVGAHIFGRLYKEYLFRGQAELEEYLLFLKHLRRRVSLDSEPYFSASMSFEGKLLIENGFLEFIKNGLSPKDAFDKASASGRVLEKERELVRNALGELGRNALTDELKSRDIHISLIEEGLQHSREELQRKIKSTYAIILATALGIGILLL